MQNFALLHDGSKTGWHASYFALHVSARLGAQLRIFLNMKSKRQKNLIEIAARASGVVIDITFLDNMSTGTILTHSRDMDGLFVHRRFIPDGRTARRYVNKLSRPLWVVSRKSEIREIAALVNNPIADVQMLAYAGAFSHRIHESISGIIRNTERKPEPINKAPITNWVAIQSFSQIKINNLSRKRNFDLLFVPATRAGLVKKTSCNCVLFPTEMDA